MDDRVVWPVLLGAAAVVALLLAVVPEHDPEPTPSDPVAAFLEDYERSRTETFAVDQTFTRTAPGQEGGLSYDQRLVQRPPDDRIVVGAGNAEGRLDGRVVRCATSPDGSSRCFEGDDASPYAEEVAAELESLRDLLEVGLYAVTVDDDGCYVFDLEQTIPSPPYGQRAVFCFDAATGAPTRFEVHRPEAIDVTVADDIRAEVTEEDLRPGGLGELPTTTGS